MNITEMRILKWMCNMIMLNRIKNENVRETGNIRQYIL